MLNASFKVDYIRVKNNIITMFENKIVLLSITDSDPESGDEVEDLCVED